MDWEAERDVLERILALLVSFASLADRAAGLPLCLALPLLGFLAQGEAVARSFVAGLPAGAPASIAMSRATDRAERLAADFRILVRLLRVLLARAANRARLHASVACPARRSPRLVPPRRHRAVVQPAPDTS
jgi:hypothetical protein